MANDDPAVTATLEGARAHARGQATTATAPTAAAGDGSDIDGAIWDEVVEGGSYTSLRLPRDAVLRITDLEGDGCVQLLCFRADHTAERLNVADTVKVQWQAYLGPGALLLSDMGRVLMTIVEDTSRRHDCLGGCSNRRANDTRYGDGSMWGPSPSGRDLLALGAGKQGLGRVDLAPPINLFKSVRVADNGDLVLDGDVRPRGLVTLRAELDLVVLLANTPQPLDERSSYTVTPVRCTAWLAERPDVDQLRDATFERARAFGNTDGVLLGYGR